MKLGQAGDKVSEDWGRVGAVIQSESHKFLSDGGQARAGRQDVGEIFHQSFTAKKEAKPILVLAPVSAEAFAPVSS